MLTKFALLFTIATILNRNPLTYVFHQYAIVLGGLGVVLAGFVLLIDFFASSKSIDRSNLELTTLDGVLLFFLVYVLGRSLATSEMVRSLVGVSLYFGFVPVYFIAKFLKFSSQGIHRTILLSFLYLTFFGYLQWAFATPFGEMTIYGSLIEFYPMRIYSTLGSSLHFGIIYTLLLTFLNSRLLFSDLFTGKTALLALFLNLAALPLIVGTSSRGAMLLYLVSTALVVVNIPKVSKKALAFTLGGILVFLLVVFYLGFPAYFESMASRFLSVLDLSDPSNVGRLRRYKDILALLGGNPLWLIFGAGPGNTGNILKLLGMGSMFDGSYATESYFLKLLLEVGVLGVTLFYSFFFLAIKKSFTILRRVSGKSGGWLYLGIFSVLVGLLLNSMTLQSLEIPGVLFIFWFSVGLLSKRVYLAL